MNGGIPIIDLAPLLSGKVGGEDKIVCAIGEILENVGFFQILGHRFPQEAMTNMWDRTREFFDLEQEKKEEIKMCPSYPYGYSG